ncbi:putative ribonuclease H-like domain-containing protein [Tanacetum coccineum]
MDMFGPVSVESENRRSTVGGHDDCSKFSWVFFLAYKDETYDMLHDLIVGLENKLRHKVKTIRCDHGTEFKNQLMNEFCARKYQGGIIALQGLTANGDRKKEDMDSIETAKTIVLVSKPSNDDPYDSWGWEALLTSVLEDLLMNALKEEKKRIALDKGKECVDSTFTLSTANTPPQSTGNTPTDSDDDIPNEWCFSTKTLLMLSHIIGHSTAGVQQKKASRQYFKTNPSRTLLGTQESLSSLSRCKVGLKRMTRRTTSSQAKFYWSMIGCLMYLTASRPDIMFAVCLCARFQVTPKVSHLHAVKRIFRYLKHQPKLGLWYPKDSPFHLEAFSNSDYAGDNHDRRSTSGGCQYLGRRLVFWQCKKQTIVAISSTEAEYVAAASCCAQVLWMQNQLLDYGFNFMNTEIHIDNESTICIVKNPVFHSKTKHIQIRHHFIRDCYEQRLINVVKVHTDDNVADLLTKGFDLARFNFLVVTIGMMNP